MSFIPQKNETLADKRIRLLEERLEQLIAQVDRAERKPAKAVPPATEKLPDAVAFAEAFLNRTRHDRRSVVAAGFEGQSVEACPMQPAELEAIGSAAELLTDYFDRHNSRVLEGRRQAKAVEPSQPSQPTHPGPSSVG